MDQLYQLKSVYVYIELDPYLDEWRKGGLKNRAQSHLSCNAKLPKSSVVANKQPQTFVDRKKKKCGILYFL